MTEAIEKYGAMMAGFADAALERAWGAEWINLPDEQRHAVILDILDANEDEGGLSTLEYKRRIDPAPLASYARTLTTQSRS